MAATYRFNLFKFLAPPNAERDKADRRRYQKEKREREARQRERTKRDAKLERIRRDIANLAAGTHEMADGGHVWRIPKHVLRPGPCGAKTRKGTPCRCQCLPGRSRCRYHGGLSTGPKTLAGRAAIAASNRRRAQERRKQKEMEETLLRHYESAKQPAKV